MTEKVPLMPAEFKYKPCLRPVLPDPRTVRASDMTWFNTCSDNIVRTDYNTCSHKETKTLYPFGRLNDPINKPFNLVGNEKCDLFSRIQLNGMRTKCNSIISNHCNFKPKMYNKYYINPN